MPNYFAQCFYVLSVRRCTACMQEISFVDHCKHDLYIDDNVFTARCCASAVYAVVVCLSVCLSVRPSVSLSVTSRYCTKRAKRRITHTTPYDSPGTLVFWCQRSGRNSDGVIPSGGAKQRWGRLKSAIFLPLSRYISETVQYRDIVTVEH